MAAVVELMRSMESRAVPTEAFESLLNTLVDLNAAGLGERCLQAVQQMALQRRFTSKQAVRLLDTLEMISPFDKLEAAVALFDAIMAEDSFLMVS